MLGFSWLVVFMHSQTWEHFCSIDEDWKDVQCQMFVLLSGVLFGYLF